MNRYVLKWLSRLSDEEIQRIRERHRKEICVCSWLYLVMGYPFVVFAMLGAVLKEGVSVVNTFLFVLSCVIGLLPPLLALRWIRQGRKGDITEIEGPEKRR